MTGTSRWIRLDVDWIDTPWVCALHPLARYCWLQLLCYTKRTGVRGRVKALDLTVAAKRWDVDADSINDMLQAAIGDGAVAEEGDDWVVVSWSKYQNDPNAAERQRRRRGNLAREEA